MKSDSVKGIIQIVLSTLLCFIIEKYFFYAFSKVGLNFSGDMYLIMNTVKYLIMCIVVYIIYQTRIRASKNKFNKSLITSAVFSIGSCVLLVFINFILHKGINTFHQIDGYGFYNYFSTTFNLGTALSLVVNVIFKPFLLIVIFCLGVSNIIKKVWSSALIAGLLYGLYYMYIINASFEVAFWLCIIPAAVIALCTYFYKTTQNIWMVFISYALYVGVGSFVLGYFV